MNTEDTPKIEEITEEQPSDDEEEPIPPAKAPESDKKKKIRRIVFYTLALTATVIISALLSLTVFFKIDEIYVEGTKKYPENDIIAASMIEKNENLILCNTSPGEKNIIAKFPYVEDVHIQKQLFNKIAIKITEAKPFSMIKNGDRYFVLSKKGKIIEINDESKYSIPVIVGAKLKKTKVCDYAEYENENTKKYLDEVVSLVKKYEIKDVSTVDVTSMTNIFLLKKNGFKLIIGSPENLEYKFKSAVSIMNEHISETDSGVLDVSMVDAEGAKSYFKSKETSKAVSSKPVEESKPESSLTEESSEISEIEESSEDEYSENEESSEDEDSEDEEYDEDSEDEDYDEDSEYEEYNEDSEDEDYDENSEDEEYNEDSEDEEYNEEYSENEYDDEEYENNDDDGGDDEEYTDEDDEE